MACKSCLFSGSRYDFKTDHHRSYTESSSTCARLGGKLAVVNSEKDKAKLAKCCDSESGFWIATSPEQDVTLGGVCPLLTGVVTSVVECKNWKNFICQFSIQSGKGLVPTTTVTPRTGATDTKAPVTSAINTEKPTKVPNTVTKDLTSGVFAFATRKRNTPTKPNVFKSTSKPFDLSTLYTTDKTLPVKYSTPRLTTENTSEAYSAQSLRIVEVAAGGSGALVLLFAVLGLFFFVRHRQRQGRAGDVENKNTKANAPEQPDDKYYDIVPDIVVMEDEHEYVEIEDFRPEYTNVSSGRYNNVPISNPNYLTPLSRRNQTNMSEVVNYFTTVGSV